MLRHFSQAWLFATLWAVARQVPLFMGFSGQEHWSGFAIPFSRGSSWCRDRTPISCVSCIASGFFTAEPPGKPSVAQSRLSSVLKLGKCRLCRPVRCSPTGGHKETRFQSPSGRGETLDSLGWWWQLPRAEVVGRGSPWDLPGWNRRVWEEPAWACGSPPGGLRRKGSSNTLINILCTVIGFHLKRLQPRCYEPILVWQKARLFLRFEGIILFSLFLK